MHECFEQIRCSYRRLSQAPKGILWKRIWGLHSLPAVNRRSDTAVWALKDFHPMDVLRPARTFSLLQVNLNAPRMGYQHCGVSLDDLCFKTYLVPDVALQFVSSSTIFESEASFPSHTLTQSQNRICRWITDLPYCGLAMR